MIYTTIKALKKMIKDFEDNKELTNSSYTYANGEKIMVMRT